MKKTPLFSFFLIGFVAMSAQIIFMRELLIIFYGNELFLGLLLSFWLLFTAIGSVFLGSLSARIKHKFHFFALGQIIIGMLLIFIPFEIRAIKNMFQVTTGEAMPLGTIASMSALITAPFCMLLGFMFALACRMNEFRTGMRTGITGVYMLETIGASLGGVITSAVLIHFLNIFYAVAMLALVNFFAALLLLYFSQDGYLKKILVASTVFLITIFIGAYCVGGWASIDSYSRKLQWKGFNVIASDNSIYGNITLARKNEAVSFFNNGLLLYTIPDKQAAEEAVHFALLQHQNPKDILLIGAGAAGLMQEIISYPSAAVDYVELDPLIITMADRYLSYETNKYRANPRVTIQHMDGRLFVKNTHRKYDCIIIHVGDPVAAQLNRYYTVEFFEEIKNILKENGIFSFSVSAGENYLSADLKRVLQSLCATLREVFADVKVIPGDTAYFLASNKKHVLSYDCDMFIETAKKRKLDLQYMQKYYLASKLSAQRVQYLEAVLEKKNKAAINYDFRPISYFYETIFRASLFRESLLVKVLRAITSRFMWIIFSAFLAAAILLFMACKKHRDVYPYITIFAVGAAGFSHMAFQIILLLSFQILYGYMFYKLGLMVTCFMIGLALGVLRSTLGVSRSKNITVSFLYAQLAIIAYAIILPLFFYWQKDQTIGLAHTLGSELLFPFISALAGFIGGWQFSLASIICLDNYRKPAIMGNFIYGADLLGACLGALVVSAFLIPVVGIPGSCFMLAMTHIVVCGMLVASARSNSVNH